MSSECIADSPAKEIVVETIHFLIIVVGECSNFRLLHDEKNTARIAMHFNEAVIAQIVCLDTVR